MVQIITRESLQRQALQRRIDRVQRTAHPHKEAWIAKLQQGHIPNLQMDASFDTRQHTRVSNQPGVVAEFAGANAGKFASGFFTRTQYQVDAGRDLEPILFGDIYTIVEDSSIQETERIPAMSADDVGVVFKAIQEGGEVEFASVTGSEKVITQVQYAAGIEYTKRMFKFNRAFEMAMVERRFGAAANALQNHVHMQPILTHSYAARQQTDGTVLSSFKATASLVEKYHQTIDAAISHARQDAEYKRRGPYAILCSLGDLSTVRRAVSDVQQQGFQQVSQEVVDTVRTIIAYDGWQGVRGQITQTYPGVSSGTAYLIDLSNREFDFLSYYSQPLLPQQGSPDVSRFVMEQMIWDMFFGVYAAPERAVEAITWPGASDGAA